MARKIRSSRLDTRSSRAKLPQRDDPFWHVLSQGLALGYRKGIRGGVWIAKHVGRFGRREKTIGPADDVLDADGVTAFSFGDAQDHARKWQETLGKAPVATARYTVGDAMDDYMENLRAASQSAKSISTTQNMIDAHIKPSLGKELVSALSTDRIQRWRQGVVAAPARLRTRPDAKKQNVREKSDDKDYKRRRQATANRIYTVLRAALNQAFRNGKVSSDDAWRRVKPFAKVDAAKIRYLSREECQRLVKAADDDLRRIIRAGLLTGCRYGEIAELRVGDYNPDANTLTIRHSKAGHPRHIPLDDDGKAFFAGITAERETGEVMFLKAGKEPWGEHHQSRPMVEACETAGIKPAASFHVLRHTFASHLAMNGVPMAVIAAILGHSDTRMTEKHYAHLSPDHVALTLRANAPKLGVVEPVR